MALTHDLRVIWFDQDDTLYDYHAAMRRSLAAALAVARQALPGGGDGLDVDELAAARAAVADRCNRAGMNFVQARTESFKEALRRFAPTDDRLAQAMTEAYYTALQTDIRPFPETEPCLQALQARWPLGVLSNGMALVGGLGIARYFRHLLYTGEVGLQKPQLEFFRLAERTAGAQPHQCLLVGDNEVADVLGAREAGWHAVWLNPTGRGWCADAPPPHHVIRSLAGLPALLGALTGR
ncbi:MAG: HAD family hydrolase [Armatimonadota bacterium]